MRKPLVDLASIALRHKLASVDKIVVRKGGEKLLKQQPKTSKKLP
jgi:hypothetical protein